MSLERIWTNRTISWFVDDHSFYDAPLTAPKVKIFRAMSDGHRADLETLASHNRGNDSVGLLCQNQAILCPGFSMGSLDLRGLLREVEFELHYFKRLLSMIKSSGNLCHQPCAALLFGIRPATGPGFEHLIDYFTVEKDSYLGLAYDKNSALSAPPEHQNNTIVLPAYELDQFARKTVEAEMRVFLFGLHDKLRGMRILQPCMDAAIHGSCKRYNCARDHVVAALPDYPSLMVQLVLQIICALNCLWFLPSPVPSRRREICWFWIRKLFETLHPLPHRLVCATLHHDIPSGEESIRIVQKWINDMVVSDVEPWGPRNRFFLSDCIMLSLMVGTVYDLGVPSHFGRAGAFYFRRPDLVRQGDTVSIVEDLLVAIGRVHHDANRLIRGILAFRYAILTFHRDTCAHSSFNETYHGKPAPS